MGSEMCIRDRFSNKVSNVQQEMLDANPDIQDLYDHIQAINAEYEEGSAQ